MGSYDSFSVLVLREVRENSWNLTTFSLLLKNPFSFLYHFGHEKFVFILKLNTDPCRNFREISFLNVNLTCARCDNLYTMYICNISANTWPNANDELTGHIVCKFWNYKQLRCGVTEKMPLNTVYKLPHRAQVRSTFKNEISLKVRQGTVLPISINTIFACSKR